MSKSKDKKNKSNSTKWQPFALNIRVSRIFILLMFLALVKGGILAFWGINSLQFPVQVKIQNKSTAQGFQLPPIKNNNHIQSVQQVAAAVQAVVEPDVAHAESKKETKASKDSSSGSLSEQMQALKRRQQELKRKEQDLQALQASLQKKLKELKALEKSVKKMLQEADVMKDEKVKHLVSVYANMKAPQAAQVLENLDEKLAVKILAGMNGRTAGKILSSVKAEKAAKLSEELTNLQVPFAD